MDDLTAAAKLSAAASIERPRSPVAPAERSYRYYDFVMAAYVCILLCANLIGPAKVSTVQLPLVGSITFMAGVLFFPLSYIFGDILTEVYGYARDRRVVWAGCCSPP
jgi:uncharacterized PurR-regulated membrane protein YhhQ (DUF165 family)